MKLDLQVAANARKQRHLLQSSKQPSQLSYKFVGDRHVLSGLYLESKRVPDVVRYVLDLTSSTPAVPLSPCQGCANPIKNDEWQDVRADEHTSPHKRIVLLLESPHRYEYTQTFTPIAPAQGTTGEGIEACILPLLNKYERLELPPDRYELLICNPVQFQASLYELHGQSLNENSPAQRLRDITWRTLYYDMNERDGFLQRLGRYNAAAVIVACTAALKQEVLGDVRCWAKDRPVPVVEASSHPCTWRRSTVTFA
ncbi:hypothetical protein OV208_28940 [Corallococcus sp. bb12-1]|uniref:hypothetical protein n=1 Tax=Corallococcus sp. bb12-1 TaxID=2996784 RepID=UPI00226D5B48|nr:hypothetical protein [Corallococcus sp. bb12-1]MCY1045377.1 hypothetical protein [Corallococcus sp. bb12-1]